MWTTSTNQWVPLIQLDSHLIKGSEGEEEGGAMNASPCVPVITLIVSASGGSMAVGDLTPVLSPGQCRFAGG